MGATLVKSSVKAMDQENRGTKPPFNCQRHYMILGEKIITHPSHGKEEQSVTSDAHCLARNTEASCISE